MMLSHYYAFVRDFWHLLSYTPDGKRGVYCKASQKKRRKMQRRTGKGR